MQMPRKAREKSRSGIYHVLVRGINRQDIFQDDEDRQKYLETMRKIKEKSQCQLYGYCLMSNHVHLLIQEGKEEISQVMKRLGASYAYWYNWKYERSGHVFQDRYKSEIVEDDKYFLAVLRYIHRNPLQANIVNDIGNYRWSSYEAYLTDRSQGTDLINMEFALGIFGANIRDAVEGYIRYMKESNSSGFLEDSKREKRTDDEVRYELRKRQAEKSITDLERMSRNERNEILRELKAIDGISIRQLARITGLGRNVIANT